MISLKFKFTKLIIMLTHATILKNLLHSLDLSFTPNKIGMTHLSISPTCKVFTAPLYFLIYLFFLFLWSISTLLLLFIYLFFLLMRSSSSFLLLLLFGIESMYSLNVWRFGGGCYCLLRLLLLLVLYLYKTRT